MIIKCRRLEYFTTTTGKRPVKIWLDKIKDKLTQAIIYKRLRQAGFGNFGKIRSIGEGVQEMKIDYGPGYRIYFGIYQDELILLLMGGDKSTQSSDIEKAKVYWRVWLEDYNEK